MAYGCVCGFPDCAEGHDNMAASVGLPYVLFDILRLVLSLQNIGGSAAQPVRCICNRVCMIVVMVSHLVTACLGLDHEQQ